MKIKLLLLLSVVSFAGYSQPTINTFYGSGMSTYSLMESSVPLDQSASGPNLTFDFGELNQIGQTFINQSIPSVSEQALFPNANSKTSIITNMDGASPEPTEVFSVNSANTLSLSGIISPGLTINYNTDTATIGTFPIVYGYNNTDTSAGNYEFGDYSGTFTGTITTSADAYGTLDLFALDMAVTRMKIVQNLSMDYGVFTNVGTFTQTMYVYYSTSFEPLFRTVTTSINVPLLGIDDTSSSIEVYLATLKTQENSTFSSNIAIVPNPVSDVLHLEIALNQKLQNVVISDVHGKTALTSTENNADVSRLQSGIYFVKITTDAGSITKKMIRK